MAFEQVRLPDRRKAILIAVGVVVALIAAFFIIPLFFPASQVFGPSVSLSESARVAQSEAAALVQAGDYAAALARLDGALEETQRITLKSADDRYTEAKLKLYKADIYITKTREYEKGFGLLAEVYHDTNYDNTVGSEALMLALAYSVQGLDERSLTIAQVQEFVLPTNAFGAVLDVNGEGFTDVDTREELDLVLIRGFIRAIDLTSAEKVYRLSQSYIFRLSTPYLPPEAEQYGMLVADMEQFELELQVIADGFIALGQPYEEFIAISFYNLIRAYEDLAPSATDIVANMERAHGKLAAYLASYPDLTSATASYMNAASARIVCRAVDTADFEASAIDVARIQPHLDRVLAADIFVPCPEAFQFVAEEIDARFAPNYQ